MNPSGEGIRHNRANRPLLYYRLLTYSSSIPSFFGDPE
jgi:hypothetical protein